LIEFYGDYISPDDGKYEYVVGHRVELYNLRADLGEKNNLATLEPQRAKRMLARLHVWHKTVGAEMPRLNPHYDPARALREVKEKPKIKP
jgi:arylsulfatase A